MPLTQKHNVPALRFSEFTSSYNDFQCGELFSNSRAKGWDGLPIFSVTVDRGLVRRDSLEREITTDAAPEKNLKISKTDLAYNMMRMWQGAVGLASEDGMVSPAYVVLSPKTPIHSEYFYQSLYKGRSLYLLWAYSYGLTNDRLRLYFKDFSKISCSIPDINEQQKIASFLSAVDTIIEQLSKKITLLEQYKKGIMQKLFSQEIRFKDEQWNEYPDWEGKRLGAITTFSKGKGISKNDIVDSGTVKCIRYGELYTHYGETIKDIKSSTNLSADQLVLSNKNDVIIPASGETAVDISTASCVLQDDIALGGDLNIIRTEVNGIFLAYYINSNKKNEIARLAQGISVVHLYATQLKTLKLLVPSIEEQQKIADFLLAIDQKIELIGTEFKQAKTFKKGLLQPIFV